ncbi:DJ-1/PfpI family protein [Streptosporangium sp. OZ121]|uniref:DJ-1/PfpI family protein n=1 Tax=Streptosporangium sp. OZ121 TaxID=3444183 RepID=UPI003F79F317
MIPGGRAPEYIRADPDVARIVPYCFERGLPVGTICHGPQVPAAFGLLRDCRSSLAPLAPLAPGTRGRRFNSSTVLKVVTDDVRRRADCAVTHTTVAPTQALPSTTWIEQLSDSACGPDSDPVPHDLCPDKQPAS